MKHADLLARLLPPVSYDATGARITAQLAGDGNALDDALASADAILSPDPWLFGGEAFLADWERLYQITPPAGATVEQRQTVVYARINATGGLSLPYITNLLASLGYVAVLDEPRGFRAGTSRAGDLLVIPSAVMYYLRIRIRHSDGSALSADEIATLTAWLNDIVAAGTHFTIGD
ncbi:putative phage tail protein [Paraburkholderia unamae]|uniref:Uncharacterized protein YmfQ (DUF2313 family) n=1 Tax=Paraburkholderia unamae TaxID=219649 RepID=A0ABX5KK39_9BURK|nr:putative phage tail protein [Paraburkholderia unamae]PVX80063.1 uncharacterized protein YmfQ (DUF2313 family) [Paraburkholderia unamae]